MKFLLLIVLLLAGIITAGCISENQNSVATPTPQIIYVTVVVTPTPAINTTFTYTPTFKPLNLAEKTTTSSVSEGTGECKCSGNLYNCPDFSSHVKAQACYNYCKSKGYGDVHKLDANKDGVACENS